MSIYYVTHNEATVFVKEGEFFKSQGGLVKDWGKNWKPIEANSIGEARRKGAELFNIQLSSLYLGEK